MRKSVTKVAYSVEEFAQAVGLSRNHAYALVRGGPGEGGAGGLALGDPGQGRRALARGFLASLERQVAPFGASPRFGGWAASYRYTLIDMNFDIFPGSPHKLFLSGIRPPPLAVRKAGLSRPANLTSCAWSPARSPRGPPPSQPWGPPPAAAAAARSPPPGRGRRRTRTPARPTRRAHPAAASGR